MALILPSIGSGIIASPTAPATFNTYSVDLDGTNDYINAVSPSALSNVEAISVWFKPDSAITSTGLKGYLLGLGGSDIGISLGGNWFGPVTDEVISVVNVNHVWSYTGSGVTVSSGTWHHLGVRWESSSSSTNSGVAGYDIYLDGTKVGNGFGTYSSGGGAKITTSAITAGARNRNGTISMFYNGFIDELGIFTSAVSESDLLAMYNSGVPADLSSYSPALWWRMGDNDGGTGTTITDQGSGGNDGTLVNGPTFSTDVPTAPAFSTNSIDLDGITDYVSITPSSSIDLYGVSFWINCDFTIDKNTIRGVLLAPGGTNWFLGLGGNFTGTLTDELISINTGARYGYCSSTDTISTGWHNIIAAWSTSSATTGGNGYDIYLDGVKVGNQSNTTYGAATLFSLSTSEIRFGERFGAYPYPGLMDEVAIFDSTLSASDISTIYNSGTPSNISSLSPAGWWRMGENDGATGTTITDQGSGGNDATLVNGPTFSTDVPS